MQPKPNITSFLIADTVLQEKGTNKWSAVGIFDRIQSKIFPCIHPSLGIYMRLSDAQGKYKIKLEFRDVEHRKLGIYEGITLDVPSKLATPDFGIQTRDLRIPKPGEYFFDLYFNEEHVESLKFTVHQLGS